MNVVNFPVCRNVKGRHWYGGRGFDTKQEVIDSMSDKDWRRIVQWEFTQPRQMPRPPKACSHVVHLGKSGT